MSNNNSVRSNGLHWMLALAGHRVEVRVGPTSIAAFIVMPSQDFVHPAITPICWQHEECNPEPAPVEGRDWKEARS